MRRSCLVRTILCSALALVVPALSLEAADSNGPDGTPSAAVLVEPPLVWEVVFTSMPPLIDGHIDEVWGKTKPLTVVVREAFGGSPSRHVILRALYTDDMLYVLAQWPDTTRSDMRDPYVWNPQKQQYERPTKPDDQFALEFPIEGSFEINMLTTSGDWRTGQSWKLISPPPRKAAPSWSRRTSPSASGRKRKSNGSGN